MFFMNYPELTGAMAIVVGIIALWDLVWKGIGMWKSARNNQVAWFVFILILNTAGLLPIIYMLWFQKKQVQVKKEQKKKKRR